MKNSPSLPVFKYFWKKFNAYPVAGWFVSITTVTYNVIIGVFIPLLLKKFFDVVYSNPLPLTQEIFHYLQILILCIAATYALKIIIKTACDLSSTIWLEPNIFNDMERDAFNKIHSLSINFFSETKIGSLISKVFRLQGSFRSVFLGVTDGLISPGVQFLIALGVIISQSWRLGLVFSIWGILIITITLLLIHRKMHLDRLRAQAESTVSGYYADTATNYMSIKLFTSFSQESQSFEKVMGERKEALVRSWHLSTLITLVQTGLLAIAEVAILWIALKLWHTGSVSIGTIILIQTMIFALTPQILGLGTTLKNIFRAITDSEEIVEILALTPEITDPQHPETVSMDVGHIMLKDVSFAYEEKPVFINFSLEIPPGQKVGLVGYSGSGKSTLTKLLLRLIDPQSGSITVDGQTISAITQDDLRSKISYVPQDPLLFHRSIRDNIAYGKSDATDEEVITAAKKANAHDFIMHIPDGYNATVGERGVKLSGGERQRVTIARAMLKEAPILILDEATSSLDTLSEQAIQKAFDKLMKGRTTIVVAHRLSTVQKLDRIIVLDKGIIIEDGSPEELLKLGGIYAKLWNTQHDGILGTLE